MLPRRRVPPSDVAPVRAQVPVEVPLYREFGRMKERMPWRLRSERGVGRRGDSVLDGVGSVVFVSLDRRFKVA
jgi:hypothetical protein